MMTVEKNNFLNRENGDTRWTTHFALLSIHVLKDSNGLEYAKLVKLYNPLGVDDA
jgi:hypothetical protein